MHSRDRVFRLLEVVTVGFPFCAFKVLTGIVLFSFGRWAALGWVLIGIGVVDLVLNAIAFVAVAATGRNVLPVCLSQWVVNLLRARRSGSRELGLSIDAMFAFTLVAAMIGFGWLVQLSRAALTVWSLSVVLNVLGAGLGRLTESVLALRPDSKASTSLGAPAARDALPREEAR